jgi:hypothetical protein
MVSAVLEAASHDSAAVQAQQQPIPNRLPQNEPDEPTMESADGNQAPIFDLIASSDAQPPAQAESEQPATSGNVCLGAMMVSTRSLVSEDMSQTPSGMPTPFVTPPEPAQPASPEALLGHPINNSQPIHLKMMNCLLPVLRRLAHPSLLLWLK